MYKICSSSVEYDANKHYRVTVPIKRLRVRANKAKSNEKNKSTNYNLLERKSFNLGIDTKIIIIGENY